MAVRDVTEKYRSLEDELAKLSLLLGMSMGINYGLHGGNQSSRER